MNPRYVLLIALAASEALAATQCKNELGKDVEWYIAYKLPKTSKRAGSDIDTVGTELAYIDANTKASSKPWRLLKASVRDTKGNPIAQTLEGLYKKQAPKNSLYVVYNDQPPHNYNGTAKGHTKGVVEFDNAGGYWLQHSVPRFPFNLFSNGYQYADSGINNGQVFMCMSFARQQLPKIAAALRMQYPFIYEADAPKSFRQDPEISALLDKNFVRKPEKPILEDELLGSKKTAFKSFAKHQRADDEVYSSVVAPRLGVDLLVETWRNGAGGKLGPACPLKGVRVSNLANVVISFSNGQKVDFKTTEDHAKWAVSADAAKPWFCIGSLNRMQSQFKRGGQTTCISNRLAHSAFTSAVDTCEVCNKNLSREHYCKRASPSNE